MRRFFLSIPFVVFFTAPGGCQSATAISIEVTTDAACSDLRGVLVTTGRIGEVETRFPSSSSSSCNASNGRVGSIVLVPSGDNNEEVAIKVVAGIGQAPDLCQPPAYAGCIVARRALRFSPNRTLHLTVPLSLSCKDVPCGQNDTCSRGACVSARLDDPEHCDQPGGCASDAGARDAVADTASDVGSETDARDAGNGCAGDKGPTPVRVDVPGHSFCIDSTTVTNAQYKAFLDSGVKPPQRSACSSNATFQPINEAFFLSAVANKPDHPVVNVDWCDAEAYCKYAGKRLCGHVATNGGPLSVAETGTTNGEMFVACSENGVRVWPYGNTYDANTCNTGDHGVLATTAVKSLAGCQGGYPGIYDLSGNVVVWINSCSSDTGADDNCYQGGGGTYGTDYGVGAYTQCNNSGLFDQRSQAFPDLGIRCCSNAL